MAIYQGITRSFLLEMLQGVHALNSDVLMLALFKDSAALSPLTTVYSTTSEASGVGYTAGGKLLTPTLTPIGGKLEVSFASLSWPSSTITARGALIYNASKANRAIAVLNFGQDRRTVNATFPVRMPAAGSDYPVMRFGA